MKNRISYFDIAKGIGIILVMFAHVTLPFIYSFHVPLFFFLSGYFFSLKKYDNFKEFLFSKFKRLLTPYIFFSIFNYLFYLVFNQYANTSLESPIKPFLGIFLGVRVGEWGLGIAALWFIQALFICEIAMYFLIKITKDNIKWLLFSLCIFTLLGCLYNMFIGVRLIWSIDVAIMSILFLGLGYIIKRINFINKIDSHILLIIFLCINLFMGLSNSKVNMYWGKYGNYLMFYMAAISGILVVLIISRKINKSRILEFIGQNTIIYLGIHQYVIFSVLNKIKNILSLNINNTILIIIAIFYVIFTIVVLYPIIKILNKNFPFIVGKNLKS